MSPSNPWPGLRGLHVSLNVPDVDASVALYRTRSGVAPANQMPDVTTGGGGALSRLDLQVDDSDAMRERVAAAGLQPRDEMQVSCCHARQDKFWLADPDGNEWEVFAALEHLSPERLRELDRRATTCSTAYATPAPAAEPACCTT